MKTNLGEQSPEDIVDNLTYLNFRANTLQNPDISVKRWETVYGPQVQEFQTRLQKEIQKN